MNNALTVIEEQKELIEKKPNTFKCILIGESGTGKSSVISQFIDKIFRPYISSTIGAAFCCKFFKTAKGTIKLDIWDTAGQERFNSMMPMYYRDANIVVATYDITSISSYEKAIYWIDRIRRENIEEPLFLLVGNKIDLEESRTVATNLAFRDAIKYNALFFECSAKTGHNVDEMFKKAVIKACDIFDVTKKKQHKIDGEQVKVIDVSKENNNKRNCNLNFLCCHI